MTDASKFTIVAAQTKHLHGMLEIEKLVFGNTAWSKNVLQDEISGNHRKYFVLEQQQKVVGYAGILMLGSDADIQTIAISPTVQGQGLGKHMLHQLLTTAVNNNCTNVFLEVRKDNPRAIKMYEQAGFKEIGIRKNYYQPDGVDAGVMQLRITKTIEDSILKQ